MKSSIGIITIGQSPRTDVVPEMAQHFGAHVEVLEKGALDDLSAEQIGLLSPEIGMLPLVTRLRDGTEVVVAKEKILGRIEQAVAELDARGVSVILLLCNGDFPAFESRCLLVEPQRIVDHFIAGLLRERHRVGILVPVEEQAAWVQSRFERITPNICVAVASPYGKREELENACRVFREAHCNLVLLYCMGFNGRLGQQVRASSGLPVVVSSSIVARALGELLEPTGMEKTIGILGGMGPEATRDLFDKIIRHTPVRKDQDHVHVIIDSYSKVPDRTANINGEGEDPLPYMVESGKRLQQAGADFIIIPCISAHHFLDRLQLQLGVEILSAFEAVAKAIVRVQSIERVGFLATDGTVKSGKFEQTLLRYGLKTLVPSPEFQQLVMRAIYMVKADAAGSMREETRCLLQSAAEHLVQRGAEGIVAGCTEIPLVLRRQDVGAPLFDPMQIVAEAAVRRAKGMETEND